MQTHDVQIATAFQSRGAESAGGTTTVVRYETSRAHHAAIDATIARIRANEATPTREDLAALDGEKVTLLCIGETMLGARVVYARPGKLFNDGEAILPKGRRSNGVRLDPSKLLGVTRGYDHAPLAELYDRYSLGGVDEVTPSVFAKLPHRGTTCSLAVVATLSVEGQTMPGCVWLCHSYMADEDIVEGMLVVPGTAGLVSEHGSVFGKDLVRRTAAVLTDAKPVPFADAINFESPEEAYAALGL